jgi:hypothetical protein
VTVVGIGTDEIGTDGFGIVGLGTDRIRGVGTGIVGIDIFGIGDIFSRDSCDCDIWGWYS